MEEPPDLPSLDPEELKKLRTPEELALKTMMSYAFVRLVIDCGCPTVDGKLSHDMFVAWLPNNFPCVREAAGLDPMPSPDTATNEKERAELAVDGYLHTIMDFAMSRCSNLEYKEAYASIKKRMEKWRESGDQDENEDEE